MIFDTDKEKDAQQVGDIKNNNVSIDTNNIDFIVTILSTNLYSKPIESFIRETVSNAWDSHIEAGVDDPVILELGQDTEGNGFCRIQDFGVGLSPERFDKIYKNIGSSTKRKDNTQIGGFGIGRFSALAYSEVVYITSNYDGKKYLYMMYKDGNSISIDLLNTQDTSERNGLEVKVPVNNGDLYYFSQAIKTQLVYFENLYIVDSTDKEETYSIAENYNDFQIKKYDNFWVNNLTSTELSLVLGKVCYPLRLDSLGATYAKNIQKYPISLTFEIGDLEVTPNREEILYSSKNQAVIRNRLDKALDEIRDLIAKEKTKNYTKFSEYISALENKQRLILLEKEGNEVSLTIPDSKRMITLNSVQYDSANFLAMYKFIMSDSLFKPNYRFYSGQIQHLNGHHYSPYNSLNNLRNNFSNTFICDTASLKSISKRYIRETFDDPSFFIKRPDSLRPFIKKSINEINNQIERNVKYGYKSDLNKFDKGAFKVIFDNILSNLKKVKVFNDSKVPQSWIDATKAADKAKRKTVGTQGFDWKQKINLHKVDNKDYGGGLMTRPSSYSFEGLNKEFKKLTVYSVKKDLKLRALYSYLKSGVRPNIVELAPTKVKLLDSFSNFVKIEDFMSVKYKLIRNIATVKFLDEKMPHLKSLATIKNLDLISPKLSKVIKELDSFHNKYESNNKYLNDEEEKLVNEIYNLCIDKNYFNEYIRGLYNEHEKELTNLETILLLTDKSSYSFSYSIPEKRINIIVDYLLARKLVRPSLEAVLKLKNETIFNIKPEDNEDNEIEQ